LFFIFFNNFSKKAKNSKLIITNHKVLSFQIYFWNTRYFRMAGFVLYCRYPRLLVEGFVCESCLSGAWYLILHSIVL